MQQPGHRQAIDLFLEDCSVSGHAACVCVKDSFIRGRIFTVKTGYPPWEKGGGGVKVGRCGFFDYFNSPCIDE